ncbi:MAG: hypothetical protein ABEH38_00770 [Flavobacteriales bacterium]
MKGRSFTRTMLFFMIPLLCSCKTYFTHGIKTDLEANNIDLKNIQYYNSKKILLKRYIKKSETKVAEGEVKTSQGRYIEEIIIEEDTKGICDSVGEEVLFIRFEPGKGKVLRFSRDNSTDDHYVLQAQEWDREEIDEKNIPFSEEGTDYASVSQQQFTGKIRYGGEIYYTQNYDEKPKLKIKKTKTSTTQKETREVEGMEVE